jgi:Arc/MetJ family transcription regulator
MTTYTVQIMGLTSPRNKVYKTLTGAVRWADKTAGDSMYAVWRTDGDKRSTLWLVSSVSRGERWHDFTLPATPKA